MDDVAKLAGISKGTLYLYFSNKEAIFHAVIQELVTPKLQEVEDMVKQYKGPADILLKQLVDHWWKNVAETRLSAIPKLIISESGNFPELAEYFVKSIVKRARKLFADVIRLGIEQGEFIKQDEDALARLVMAPMIQLVIWQHSLMQFDTKLNAYEYIKLHVELMTRALRKT